MDTPYEALPSLEPNQDDGYDDAGYEARDPNRSTPMRDDDPVEADQGGFGDEYGRERYAEPEPPFRTAAYPGTDVDDSGPRQRPRKNATPLPRYDAAAYEAHYGAQRADSYPLDVDSYDSRQDEQSYPSPQRREDSYSDRQESWSASPYVPPAPSVPRDMNMPAGFVMGVQPIRTPGPIAAGSGFAKVSEAFPQGVQAPRTPIMGVNAPHTVAASPRAMGTPVPTPSPLPQAMHGRLSTNRPYAQQPVGHQLQMTELEEAQQGSKVGRFAWFVFGAAFGIFFAFLATGFVPHKKDEAQFPPPAPIPTQQQTPGASPPPVQTPAFVVPTLVQPPPSGPAKQPVTPTFVVPPPSPVSSSSAGAETPAAPLLSAAATTPVAPKSAAPAPTQRGQRAAAIARRPAPAPTSAAPKPLPNSGTVTDDDAPAPSAREKPAQKEKAPDVSNLGDLLKDGLAP